MLCRRARWVQRSSGCCNWPAPQQSSRRFLIAFPIPGQGFWWLGFDYFFWKSYKSLSFGVMNIQPIAAILIYFDVHQFCNTSPSDRLILFSSIVCVLSASQLLEMTIPQDYTRSSGEYRGHETHRWSREESRTLLWQRGCWYCCGSLGVLHCKGQRVELLWEGSPEKWLASVLPVFCTNLHACRFGRGQGERDHPLAIKQWQCQYPVWNVCYVPIKTSIYWGFPIAMFGYQRGKMGKTRLLNDAFERNSFAPCENTLDRETQRSRQLTLWDLQRGPAQQTGLDRFVLIPCGSALK